jgi:hypothetical protein
MISLSSQFAFIHINKTGGSSVVDALADYEDVQPSIKDHDPAINYRSVLGHALWDELYSFAFIRNPYDRMVSSYEYRRQYFCGPGAESATRLKFRDWMLGPVQDKPKNREWSNQLWMVSEKGCRKIIVKDIFLFDDLPGGFRAACKKIGIDLPPLGNFNKTEKGSFLSYYDSETAALVASRFSQDILWANENHPGRWLAPNI